MSKTISDPRGRPQTTHDALRWLAGLVRAKFPDRDVVTLSGETRTVLYALRATDPAALLGHSDPVGPECDQYLTALAREHGDVICAWGANAKPDRVAHAVQLFRGAGARLWCLGTTKAGAPRHPLYVRGDQPLIAWEGSQ